MSDHLKRILIIEDDRFLAELLEKKLVASHFEAERAIDGEGAFRILKDKEIDCILMDILLPGEDGFSILRQVKSDPQLKDIPIIIISNLSGAEEKEKALKLDAKDFLVKAEHSPESIAQRVKTLFAQ